VGRVRRVRRMGSVRRIGTMRRMRRMDSNKIGTMMKLGQ